MAIIQTICTKYQFEQAMKAAGRGDQFSYEALGVLFDYLDELSIDVEFDAVAICCEYAESSLQELIDQYSIDISAADGQEDEILDIVKEYIEDNTTLVGDTGDSLVYVQF